MPADEKESMPDQYDKVSLENFIKYSKDMFAYWTENDFAASFRKMLTLEQFRNEEMQALYQQYLVAGPAGYVKDLFVGMGMKDADNKADMFYSVMFFYYSLYDGAANKMKAKSQFEQMLDRIVEEIKKYEL